MGQAINKLTPKKKDENKDTNALNAIIEDEINKYFEKVEKIEGDTHFCHIVYEIIEKISKKSGAMLFQLPKMEELQKAFQDIHKSGDGSPLTKKEFRDIITKVIKMDSLHVGQAAKDIFLAIFGAPIIALLAKRVLPGPTAYISDEVFIPAATSCTVLFLAKTNRL